jgi:hypothetical protein
MDKKACLWVPKAALEDPHGEAEGSGTEEELPRCYSKSYIQDYTCSSFY